MELSHLTSSTALVSTLYRMLQITPRIPHQFSFSLRNQVQYSSSMLAVTIFWNPACSFRITFSMIGLILPRRLLSNSLKQQLNSDIGLKFAVFSADLLGFSTAMTLAFFHVFGINPVSIMKLNSFASQFIELRPKCIK